MKIKKKRVVSILGIKHRVKYIPLENEDGWYDEANRLIEIDKNIVNKEEYEDSILHECLHGGLTISGLTQDISLPQQHVIINTVINVLRANFKIELKK